MQSWNPVIQNDGEAKFISLTNQLERDIRSGLLEPGTKLPPYRDLAHILGVSPGTVNKAYAEAKRRGLVDGEVGRGTFIRDLSQPRRAPSEETATQVDVDQYSPTIIDLSINTPPMLSHNIVLADAFANLSRQNDLEMHSRYLPYFVHAEHREAAVMWLGHHGLNVAGDEVVLTNGAQHAMAVALSSVATRGDVLYTDTLTYPGILSLASYMGLEICAVEGDDYGMLPDKLERAFADQPGKAVYLMPTLHNPTGHTMPPDRRLNIAKVAQRLGLYILEDDIYGVVGSPNIDPLRNLAPDRTFYLTSMSKAVIPSLRIGFLIPPMHKLADVTALMRATGWTAAPLMMDVGATLILDGTAKALAEQNRDEAYQRQALTHSVLSAWMTGEPAHCYHLWLKLPEGWETERFISSAREAGVIITPTEGIRVGTGDPGGVRLCLGAARNLKVLEIAMTRLRAVLLGGMRPAFNGLI
ncbi:MULTISPECIES: PLP-dependent aminotransferase family protein [unclassified Pseudomonas]|uniref:aminotransferase-like domain-containing protein n=1 Tax=unclassified Pseudomonas TaxID=196821 RepID=UPI000D39E19F|nr:MULTISPECIES: PLP-dependent aminotransferase family protein [unclassified Pseudomonas]RAU47940.1 PLP-dependent aminotransferase family protein [Pseudomonas sp. RIT 409]RAU55366.1 PLP-dependent aminotransferase family protein [Pseudomonas sp. RIT 412]